MSQERFCTWPLFESENFTNSEMAYFMNVVSYHTAESTIVVVFVLKKTRIKWYLVILGYLWKYKRFDGDLRSSNLINIEGNITKNNKNKYSQLSPCLDAPKFVMLSFFTLITAICPKIWEKHCPRMSKVHFRLMSVAQTFA